MKKLVILFMSAILYSGICFGEQLQVISTTLEPNTASPGDSIKVSMELSGAKLDIEQVSFIPREYAEAVYPYYLKAVKNSEKNVWELTSIIPYDAPYGVINLDFTVIDKDGKEIISKSLENNTFGKAATLTLTIQ